MPKQECGFIERLYDAIEEQRSSIVDWDPSGKGFIVGNLTEFTNAILLRKFGIGRLDSFARKLNRHGFKRSKIDKNKIRFFHKYFNRESKNLNKIKKLSKYESLPKHIKLRMIREQLSHKNAGTQARQSDIVNQIFENNVKLVEEDQHDQDISSNREDKGASNYNFNDNENQQSEIEDGRIDHLMIKMQENRSLLLRTPQSKCIQLCSDNQENQRMGSTHQMFGDDLDDSEGVCEVVSD